MRFGIPIAAGVLYPLCGLLLSPIIAGAAVSFCSVSVIANALRLKKAPWHEARLPNEAMGSKYRAMPRPLKRVSNAVIALVTAVAWFLAANHCAVAGLVPPLSETSTGHEHCGGSSEAPGDNQQPGDCDGLNCCKSLSAPASFAKKLVGYDKAFHTLKDYVVSEIVFADEQHDASIAELDTGPPSAPGFAESVLQRSLLAHAPPSLS